MLIFDRVHWREHRAWAWGTLSLLLISIAAYTAEAAAQRRWPGGSSRSGYALGWVGGGIIAFEMLLAARKHWRRVQLFGRATWWMRAHIWLGLLSLPLLLLHGGFRLLANPLAGVLTLLLAIVVVSGLVGLYLQNFLPRMMLDEVPAETIYSQIGRVLRELRDEAERLVRAIAPREDDDNSSGRDEFSGSGGEGRHLTLGVVRSAGRVQGKVLQSRAVPAPIPGAEPIRKFFEEEVVPFLEARSTSGFSLASRRRSDARFRDLTTELPTDSHFVLEELESLCDQRRQFDRQARLHGVLHGWLVVHVPLSFAMFALMIFHVAVVVRW